MGDSVTVVRGDEKERGAQLETNLSVGGVENKEMRQGQEQNEGGDGQSPSGADEMERLLEEAFAAEWM
jgi:hypothetical protein